MKIEHQADQHRFVAITDAGEAQLAYSQRDGGVLDLQHTFVPPDARGKGVGEALVQHALEHAREHDQRIIPSCPFVHAWLESHPGYDDLLA